MVSKAKPKGTRSNSNVQIGTAKAVTAASKRQTGRNYVRTQQAINKARKSQKERND